MRTSTEIGDPSTPKRSASSYLNSDQKLRLSDLLTPNIFEYQRSRLPKQNSHTYTALNPNVQPLKPGMFYSPHFPKTTINPGKPEKGHA